MSDKTPMIYVKSPIDGKVVGSIPDTGDPLATAIAAQALLQRLGLNLPSPPSDPRTANLRAMLSQAHAFAATAIHINKDLIQKRNIAGVPTFAVNASFSLEVYLKLLSLRFTGKVDRREHNLQKLYEALPQEAHVAIQAEIPAAIAINPENARHDLSEVLSELATAFIEWRYRYEDPKPMHIPLEATVYAMKLLNAACRTVIQTASTEHD